MQLSKLISLGPSEHNKFGAKLDTLFKQKITKLEQEGYKTLAGEIKHLVTSLSPITPSEFTFGIEVEMEHILGYLGETFPNSHIWKAQSDGSLRDHGLEFVSCVLRAEDVVPAVSLLYGWLANGRKQNNQRPSCSWRTSTHVHVDAMSLTTEEFNRLLLLYLIFENALFEFANPGRRETNIFCAPISRTQVYALEELINSSSKEEYKNSLWRLENSFQKYSAVNLLHLFDYGTLEFRHMRATEDPEFLVLWIELLNRLFLAAKHIPTKKLHDTIMCVNTNSRYSEFMVEVFGPALAEELSYPLAGKHLSSGVTLTKELISGIKLADSLHITLDSGLAQFIKVERERSGKDLLAAKQAGRQSKSQIVENTAHVEEFFTSFETGGQIFTTTHHAAPFQWTVTDSEDPESQFTAVQNTPDANS